MSDNIVSLPTLANVPLGNVLDGANEARLGDAVVIGTTIDGEFYFASTTGEARDVAWLLQRAMWTLNKLADERGEHG